jgi:4-hydroxy-3-methylbut-2-enyl diphosphate reductase
MEIIIAKNSGFCSGVKTAVDTAYNIKNENVYILGELIHNQSVTDKIIKSGIKVVDDISEIPNGTTVIIRSHGVGKKIFDIAKEKKLNIVDCTCKFVQKTQNIVKEYFEKSYQIIIVGEKNHPEVQGLCGWCNENAIVLTGEEDLNFLNLYEKLCIVAQTTTSNEKFEKIIENIKKVYNKTLEIFKTICYTTIKRQNEAEELSKTCDAIIILGGLNSSNTNKLYDICINNCKNVYRVNRPADLDYKCLTNFKKVAIVSGASTPDEQTQEVFSKMEKNITEANVATQSVMEKAVADLDEGKKDFKKGQIIKAAISSADDDGLAILLPMNKKETILPKEQVECEVYDKNDFIEKIGSEIEVMVTGFNPLTISQKSIRKIKEEEALIVEIENGKEFSVIVDAFNKGGLTAKFGSYPVFIPAKEIRSGFVKDLEKYVGKKLRLKVIEIKKDKKKEIIASQRVILEAEKAEKDKIKAQKEEEFFASINVNDIVSGKVERFSDFGAFVSVKGFDCLAHISDLSWTSVKTPADVLEIGQNYDFKILKINAELKKVSIGFKQLQPEPWEAVAEKYHENDIINGKVVRIAPFGAFVEVEKGIDALVRVSEISHEWVENPTTFLAIGQDIEAKIIMLDPINHKMTLSIKALTEAPVIEKPIKAKKEKTEKSDNTESTSENSYKERVRKPRFEKKTRDENEIREWNEGGLGGASIGEMLNKK